MPGQQLHQLAFQIDGMHCDACIRRVTRALGQVPGTYIDEVRVGAVRLRTDAAAPEAYLAALRNAGFEARLAE